MTLRVLHFLDTEQFAGTEQHILTLSKHLLVLGIECALLCKKSNVEFVQKARAIPDLNVFAEQKDLRQTVEQWKPAIVHTHDGRTSLLAARLGKNDLKRVFTQHFVAPMHTRYRGVKRFAAMAAHGIVNARTDKIIAVSEAARLAMIEREHLPVAKIVTVWNGIEPPQLNAERAEQILRQEEGTAHPLLLTIARLASEKGYRTLLEAIPMVLEKFPDARFVWIGEGELEQELRQRLVQKGVQNSVRMLGYQDKATDFLSLANAFILPSDCEPFGLVLVEAMMSGVPVIATDCGGAKEIVAPALEPFTAEKGVGWLVPPKSPQALAQAILECIAHSGLAGKIGARGKQRALTHFTAERMAHQTIAVYEEIIN